MNEQIKPQSPFFGIVSMILACALGIVGYMYYEETNKPPEEVIKEVTNEVIKEVPVETIKEVIKEVPVEVIKEVIKEIEVPAELTDYQEIAINFTRRWLDAPRITEIDEIFYGIQNFNTRVVLDEAVQKVVSEDRLRNKLELILRRNKVSIDPKSDYTLIFYVSGFWDEEELRLTYQYSLKLLEDVVLARKGDLRRSFIYSWETGTYGYAGKNVAENAMLENVESVSEAFSNRYLKILDKEKRRIEQDASRNGE